MGNQRTDRASRHSHRQETVQQQTARQQRRSKIAQTMPAQQYPTSLQFWIKLFQRHSALLLIVIWAVLLGTAIAAVTAIVDPDVSVRPPVLRANVGSVADSQRLAESDNLPIQRLTKQRQASRRSQSASGSPLSAGGALLLSCAGGCLLLSRCLQPQPVQQSRRRVAQQPTESQSERYQSEPHQPDSLPPSGSEVDPALRAFHSTTFLPASHWPNDSTIAPAQPKPEPAHVEPTQPPASVAAGPALPVSPVSILPAEHNHPLDWDEPSLADSLDLRQKRPLSYWLRG